ncbi:hypothetical protein F5Y19DRAFT_440779 [Xylariaceae sp. FL1651]|nr:hypothetical protein F5Y19DRAFT_440779 [Xylariaceae sp. FL1651]
MAEERLIDRTKEQQLEFVRSFWPSLDDDAFQHEHYTRFLKFIDRQMSRTREYPGGYSEQTLDGVAEYIRHLRENLALRKIDLVENYNQEVSRTLDLAATIWLTILVDTETTSHSIIWNNQNTIEQVILPGFSTAIINNDTNDMRRDMIPPSLTMAYLCRRYGFTVAWTDDLRYHLNIDWENHKITVYEHLIYLSNYLFYPAASPIPTNIVEEAIDTINLLFPSDEKGTRKFLRARQRNFDRFGYCGRERRLHLSKYHHWRAKLKLLKEVMEGQAKGINQLMLHKERRNFLDWATFWVAVIVALLTIITSLAFGVVGIVYAVRSYEVGKQQLDIAIAMACVDAETAARLPKYCP